MVCTFDFMMCKIIVGYITKDLLETNRIYHWSLVQTEKSQPEDTQIMSETRLLSFRHYPLTRGLEFLGLHRTPMIDYFSYI